MTAMTRSLGLFLLLLLGLPGHGSAQETCPAVAAYRVQQLNADVFRVEADFTSPASQLDVFFFPVEDRPQGQAESIRNLEGFSASGDHVALEYIGEGAWTPVGSTGVSRVTYEVHADHDKVDWGIGGPGKDEVATRFDNSYFFAGHAFFLIDYSAPECPVTVEFDLPPDWNITSPWKLQGRTAIAANPWNLGQNAFAMGPAEPVRKELPGLTVDMLVSSQAEEIAGDVSELLSVIPQTYTDFFGSSPEEKYSVFLFTDKMSDGGAFQNSFAMRVATPISPTDKIVWSHTLGHEIMHLWIGAGAIHGVEPDDIYWFTEGFTDYLTIKLMYQAGLIDEAMLKQRIANILRRYEIAKRRSPDISLAEAGKNKGDNWELIYGGGSLVALVLDATVSAENPGMFRHMMRDLYEQSESPYTLASLVGQMDQSTDGLASLIVDWIDSHPEANEIRQRLLPLGLDLTTFRFDEAYVGFSSCEDADCVPGFLERPQSD